MYLKRFNVLFLLKIRYSNYATSMDTNIKEIDTEIHDLVINSLFILNIIQKLAQKKKKRC